jgi:uncharacterized membrane protein YcaP (DUF421 family)
MFQLMIPWWELIIRAVIVYAALVLLVRLTGKRQIGQLSPFDLILLLILSESVQNAMTAGENSVTGGIILAATLVTLNFLVGIITFRSDKAERVIQGHPEILVRDGKIIKPVMIKAKISQQELESALREAGFFNIEDVKMAILEDTGRVSVQGYDESENGRRQAPKQ